ncbi:hypothetical protein ACFQL0_11785 [Haloplanus litoreus]|uniref:hypothetical protein n=1 Tax=Haloplanus litoreus TaxID=767515 RepID=UPI003612A94F
MRISEIEIHEFDYEVARTGTVGGNWVYDPDSTLEPPASSSPSAPPTGRRDTTAGSPSRRR